MNLVQVLAVMFHTLELLKLLQEDLSSGSSQLHGGEQASVRPERLCAAAEELQQSWRRSSRCRLQLQTRLEMVLDWAQDLQRDAGTLGEYPLLLFIPFLLLL